MWKIARRAALALAASCSPIPATAADITVEPATKAGAKDVISIQGAIESGDADRFRQITAKITNGLVLLNSDGGVLTEALEIGQLIQSRGWMTGVTNGYPCNSSCALIWLAGKPRVMTRSSRVGFHAAYTRAGSANAQESGVANALVGRYLTQLNLPKSAVLFATTPPPETLNYLTAYNFEAIGISSLVINDLKSSPTARTETQNVAPPPLVRTTTKPTAADWKKVGGWQVRVDYTLNNSCFALATYEKGTWLRIGVDDREGRSYYLLFGNQSWQSLAVGDEHKLILSFDQESPWAAEAKVINLNGFKALSISFKEVSFWKEFMRAQQLLIRREGKEVDRLSLPGSAAAVAEIAACQKYHDALGRSEQTPDPFAK